jgi:hypothetical protein
MAHMSDRRPDLPNRQIPFSEAFGLIVQGWASEEKDLPNQLPAAVPARSRRQRVSPRFPGERLVIPAGGLKVRANDTDYRFRPHSAFAHLTGLGTDREPDAVLVLEPTDAGHDAALYFRPRPLEILKGSTPTAVLASCGWGAAHRLRRWVRFAASRAPRSPTWEITCGRMPTLCRSGCSQPSWIPKSDT